MIKRSPIFAALFAVAWGQAARAQERVPCVRLACAASMAERPGTFRINELVNAPRSVPRTYWLEGGIAGGIGLGLVAAVLYGGLCLEESQSCTSAILGSFVFGGALGFTVGALVGGQFRKGTRDTASGP